ncbi:DUF2958 domain-containing protein [Ferrovibrio sp. MS7]|uniref:DUF2958 domain-containing protein n=1 Tax=Ferrovibrio plantarum TaxID=3119164 RepID=UPI003136D05A
MTETENTQDTRQSGLLTPDQKARMLANGRAAAEAVADDGNTPDVFPVVKLFVPWGAATWLLSELDLEDEDIAFGLCDLGFGCPELGSVRISELESVRGPGGLAIERDLHFRPCKALTAYAAEASRFGRIRA